MVRLMCDWPFSTFLFYRMDKKDFSKFIFDIYSHGALNLSISIGHDLGLFNEFFGTDEPLSVLNIAQKLDLKER